MTKLNCGVSDLAITVACNYPENLGKIVHILKPVGFKEWFGIEGPAFTWEVVVAGEKSWLLYEIDGCLITKKVGLVPDLYLRRITPPKIKKQRLEQFSQQGVLDLQFKDQKEFKNVDVAHVLI
jgi:hypothetical protein